MGIEGYLVRVDAAAVAEIRKQAQEKRFDLLEAEMERAQSGEWLDQKVLNQPMVEDENDEGNDMPDEQYFPTVCYEWFPPCDSPSGDLGSIMARYLALGNDQEVFMRRVCVFRLLQLFPPAGLGGISAIQASRAWTRVKDADKSLCSGIMQDWASPELVRTAVGLCLLQEVGSAVEADDKVFGLTERGGRLVRDVRLGGDDPFFWEKDWAPDAPPATPNPPPPSGAPGAPGGGLLDLPHRALVRVLLRLDSPGLSRVEALCRRSRGMTHLPRQAGAAPAANGDELLTPLGKLAWFACHRRGHGNAYVTKALLKTGYRRDCIRRDLRTHAVQRHLRSVGGMRLGGEWHMLAHGLGKDVCVICVGGGAIKEREIGYTKGGSGIPVLVHSPEEVARETEAMRALYHYDKCCLCSDPEVVVHRPGNYDARCKYHPAFENLSSWDFAAECQKAGVLCPRYADDLDHGWRFRVLWWFVEATCKNGQGLLCYVW